MTKLERFIREHHIKPAELAREAGCSREHLFRIRLGRIKHPRGQTKQAIAAACTKLSRIDLTVDDIFDDELPGA